MAPSARRPSPTRQQSTTPHYQTFPTQPPKSRGKPLRSHLTRNDTSSSNGRPVSPASENEDTPLPKGQLLVLAIIALAEQTALNSISPYLPDMASTFPEVKGGQVGMYVGLIASSFALAQFATNFFWGWLSDRIGRKPVVLLGTLLTAACFVAFGLCRTLWQAVLVQVLMGLVNGNQGVVSTCLGEITDRSNQSKAFTYLPVVYGIGGITGPVVGGLLVRKTGRWSGYPYLLPNLVAAGVLLVDLGVTMVWLEESLEEAKSLAPLGKRVTNAFTSMWQFMSSSTSPTYTRPGGAEPNGRTQHQHHRSNNLRTDTIEEETFVSDSASSTSFDGGLFPQGAARHVSWRQVLNRDTILILATFFIFQLSNISYNSLYPIFGQAQPPTGRGLSPTEIGISLGFAGLVTIVFQVGVFGRLRERIGNKTMYRVGFAGFVVAFLLMPFVGYKEGGGNFWLWGELGVVLVVKTVAAVATLTSALLLITNSAPDHSILGTLNGLAQTLSAAGRAVGPFLSGSLFSASVDVQPKGEALAFGVFAGFSLMGFLLSFGIKGTKLECKLEDDGDGSVGDLNPDEEGTMDGQRRSLMGGRK